MTRLRVLAFALALISATQGAAETGKQEETNAPPPIIRFGAEVPIQVERRGFSFPVIEYTDPAGARQERRGIVASKEIAPNTLIGVGFFRTTPRSRTYIGDPSPNAMPRRSKRAAIGLSWKF